MSLTQNLADILDRPISKPDRDRANILLLDWLGCAVAGRREQAGQKISNAFPDEIGPCTRIGGSAGSPLMAALQNGCLGNVLEMDDVDKRAILHAAPTIIPAALAMAEYTNAAPNALLDAIVKGYEVTIRIGRAVGPGHYAYWHNTATCGPFGAAAAACHLLEGSDLVSALGLAGTQAAGLWQTRHEPDSMAKQLHAGHAAHAGVLAAILSVQGFQGPRTILEGEQGFFAAMCPGANAQDVLRDYGEDWLLHQTSLKPYPACRHAHPVIDAAREIKLSDGPIVIETYADALKFCDRPDPAPGLEAKFSLQHTAAFTLLFGAPKLADFDQAALDKTAALRSRISVRQAAEFDDVYPAHFGAAISIGAEKSIVSDAYGDPEFPMQKRDIEAKARTLMQYGGMSEEEAGKLIETVLVLPAKSSLSGLKELLP